MGGGPSAQQNQAAAAQANMTDKLSNTFDRQEAFSEDQQNKVNPFYTSRMSTGLPYYNALTDSVSGTTAKAFAPARAALSRSLTKFGTLPSGYADAARRDLDTNQARTFDDNLVTAMGANDQAKQQGAAGLIGQAQVANPTAYSGQALQGNQSIMNAPLAKPGLGGLLGGIAGGAMSAIPF